MYRGVLASHYNGHVHTPTPVYYIYAKLVATMLSKVDSSMDPSKYRAYLPYTHLSNNTIAHVKHDYKDTVRNSSAVLSTGMGIYSVGQQIR